jgi:hypothetical protein
VGRKVVREAIEGWECGCKVREECRSTWKSEGDGKNGLSVGEWGEKLKECGVG